MLNRTPTTKLHHNTPYELVTVKRQLVAHLHHIGCKAFAFALIILRRDKMEEKANIGYLLSYSSTNFSYIWIPNLNKTIRTRDFIFNEDLYNSLKDIILGQFIDKK